MMNGEDDDVSSVVWLQAPTYPSRAMQLTAVLVCGLASFGYFSNYEVPGALAVPLKELFHVDESSLGSLYAVSTVPGVPLVLVSGYAVDAFGLRAASTLCSGLVLLGSVLFALAGQTRLFPLALFGRLIFGVGGDSIAVCCDAVLCLFFSPKRLAIAIAVVQTFLCAADFGAFAVLPRIAAQYGLMAPLWLATVSCGVGFGAVLLFWSAEEPRKRAASAVDEHSSDEPFLTSFPIVVRLFERRFWILVFVGSMLGAVITTYTGFAADILVERNGLDIVSASQRTSLLTFSTMIGTPLQGFMLSGSSPRVIGIWLTVAASAVALSFLYLLVIPLDASTWPALLVIGFSMATLTSGVWPIVPLVSPSNHTGMAFGIAYAVWNACVSLMYWICGEIVSVSPGLMLQFWAMTAFATAALALFWTFSVADQTFEYDEKEVSKDIEA
jgi:nitrate/nitrite transporter NarK